MDALSQTPVPDNVRRFIEEINQRAFRVTREETAELFRTTDEATALLIAHDKTAKALCYRAEENRLVVPARHVAAFRRALRELGFVAPHE